MAEGRAERESVPLEAHGEWARPTAAPTRSASSKRRTRRACPSWCRSGTADDRLAVHVLPRRRRGHGVGPGVRPATGLRVRCCGDAHLSNFGIFAAPDRQLVFDLNDFDETLPAPFEWDVKRLVASIVVAGRGNGHRRKEQRAAVRAAAAAYRTAIAKAAHDAVPRRLVHAVRRRRGARGVLADRRQGRAQGGQEGDQEGEEADEPRLAVEVRGAGRRWLQDQAAAARDRAPARDADRGVRPDRRPGAHRLRELARPRPASRARPLPLRGLWRGRSSASGRSEPRR